MDTLNPIAAATPKVHLEDYKPTPFAIRETHLDFDLHPSGTRVRSRLVMERTGEAGAAIKFDGHQLKLVSIQIDGEELDPSRYTVTDTGLEIRDVPDAFVLEIENTIDPEKNTALEGLYMSGGRFCTQCEALGFRRITYFYDRPDVLSRYFVRVTADKTKFPTLLSNGNKTAEGDLEGGRHFAEFEDPHPKPCYLFALVAGEFETIHDTFTTMSGKEVDLYIHVDPGDGERAHFALDALKRSMKWDEETFKREYDLSVYHIVAVRDYNFGAMENKGLNVFNSSVLLADSATATDDDFHGVERVIAHEYFHNWTGNRITLRDWFQLCLKEGLTVYRDQEFSSDQLSRPVQRIKDVSNLRSGQYTEDAGPMAHAARPSEYSSIENFYTSTVYRKGAEINRVLREILGEDMFAQGLQRYFEKYDGQAITLEDYVSAFEDVTGRKLDDFFRWYEQAGTPHVTVSSTYDEGAQTLSLTVSQKTPPTPGQPNKRTLPIPLRIGFISKADGRVVAGRLQGENAAKDEHRTVLTEDQQTFVFENVDAEPIPAVLRGFNAPVIVHDELTIDDRLMQMAHDTDPFTRWDAGQTVMQKAIMARSENDPAARALADQVAEALSTELAHADDDRLFAAQALRVPSLGDVMLSLDAADPERLYQARNDVCGTILNKLEAPLVDLVKQDTASGDDRSPEAIGQRALRGSALALLSAGGEKHGELILSAFNTAKNMTESAAALRALSGVGGEAFAEALSTFYDKWHKNPLVLDKWFSVQAACSLDGAVERIKALTEHELFTFGNPNRARSVYGVFGLSNPRHFHAADGSGYRLLADAVLASDKLNPMLAARMARSFDSYNRVEAGRREKCKAVLEAMAKEENLSRNLREVVENLIG